MFSISKVRRDAQAHLAGKQRNGRKPRAAEPDRQKPENPR
jgi:hypothetical protein